jgi:hypothetical protein
LRCLAVKVEEEEAVPDFRPEFPELPIFTVEALGFPHFGTCLQLAIEFEGPKVIGAKEESGLSTACVPVSNLRRAVTVMSETGRHNVHRAVWADSRKDSVLPLFVLHRDHWFTEKIKVDEVAVLRQLRKVSDSIPVFPENVFDLPIEKLSTGVCLRRKGCALRERQISDSLNLFEDLCNGEFGTSVGDGSPVALTGRSGG